MNKTHQNDLAEAIARNISVVRHGYEMTPGTKSMDEANAALDAIRASIPQIDDLLSGKRIAVPVEPNLNHITALSDQIEKEFGNRGSAGYYKRIYSAVIKAEGE